MCRLVRLAHHLPPGGTQFGIHVRAGAQFTVNQRLQQAVGAGFGRAGRVRSLRHARVVTRVENNEINVAVSLRRRADITAEAVIKVACAHQREGQWQAFVAADGLDAGSAHFLEESAAMAFIVQPPAAVIGLTVLGVGFPGRDAPFFLQLIHPLEVARQVGNHPPVH